MAVPPTQKLDIPAYVMDQGVQVIEDFLVANGWTAGDDRTHNYACAVFKLGAVDNLHKTVAVHLERTPAHIQITVDNA